MPAIGLGTWPMDDRQAEETIAKALQIGYRLIDTAAGYKNEIGVGRGVRASGIDRANVFISTKVTGADHGFEQTQKGVAASLKRLGLKYVDLVLIHWPMPEKNLYVDTWRALLKLQQEGVIRVAGVSNFEPSHLQRLLDETGVMPPLNQVQLNPRRSRVEERSFHGVHGITTECYTPILKGQDLLDEAPILTTARRLGKTPAQVVLRWHVQQGLIPIPKTTDPQHLRENIDVFDFTLAPDDIKASTLDAH